MKQVKITPLPQNIYEVFENSGMTEPSGCYSNCLRATLWSKSDKVSNKFDYVAGWVIDKLGKCHEHAFLRASNNGEYFYFDPTLERDKDRAFFIHKVEKTITIQELEQAIIEEFGEERFKSMKASAEPWCQPRLKDGRLFMELGTVVPKKQQL